MKAALLLAALLAVASAGPAPAHESHGVRLNRFDCDEPLRWGPRHAAAQARHAITSEDGKLTFVLTDRVLALQFSDRTMRKLDRELHRARHEDDDSGPVGEAIKVAVVGAVRSMLAHSAECPVRELRDVRVADGRLVIVARDGARLFERFEVDDEDVLDAFDPRDAERLAAEFRRLRPVRD